MTMSSYTDPLQVGEQGRLRLEGDIKEDSTEVTFKFSDGDVSAKSEDMAGKISEVFGDPQPQIKWEGTTPVYIFKLALGVRIRNVKALCIRTQRRVQRIVNYFNQEAASRATEGC